MVPRSKWITQIKYIYSCMWIITNAFVLLQTNVTLRQIYEQIFTIFEGAINNLIMLNDREGNVQNRNNQNNE